MNSIVKYKNGELVYWTSIDGTIWHSDKVVQQLKVENEALNTLFKNYKKKYINSTNKLGEMVIKNGNLYNEKDNYKQCLDEIERLTKMHIQECIDFDDCYRAREQMKMILQKIKEVKNNE